MADEKTAGTEVCALIETALTEFLGNPASLETARAPTLPREVVAMLDAVLSSKQGRSYRDAALIQLGYGVIGGSGLDLTQRQPSGRSVAQFVGRLFKVNHIDANNDAFENIGKNTTNLCRGNEPVFDALLHWTRTATADQISASFYYLLASRASTARPVSPMPRLERGGLTFARVAALFEDLLQMPSGGAHEQFSVTACIHAIIDEYGQGGPNGLQVRTKNIYASDASTRSAADLQIVRGNKTEEAFEVTANDWRQKIEPAKRTIREADLPRIHIVATTHEKYINELLAVAQGIDISVLDVRSLVQTLLALMRKPARETALLRMYELLDRHQSDVARVNAYVALLHKHRLTGPL